MSYVRTTKPTKNDKYYVRKSSGGYSSCIQGKPTDKECDVLANCVGFACGFFNEYVGLGYEKYHLNCNAENFVERAIASGLSVVKNPVVGGILVWQKGNTLSGSDGAGHVAGCYWVNDVDNPTEIKTSESGYGSSAFWKATRKKGNGNWGAGSGYTYRGCIVPPNYVKPVNPTPTPNPTKTNEELADEVIQGKWGNNPERKQRLTDAGYDYSAIQSIVNQKLSGSKPQPSKTDDDLLTLVKKTIRGDFGNGDARKKALGSNYEEVQKQVNLNLNHGLTRWDNIKLF